MVIEEPDFTTSFSGRSRSISDSMQQFDLPSLIKNMKDPKTWDKGGLKTLTLINIPGTQIVLTALHEDTEIESFQSCNSVTIEIVEGRIFFRTRKESHILDEGQTLTLFEKVEYSITAREETVVLFTLACCK